MLGMGTAFGVKFHGQYGILNVDLTASFFVVISRGQVKINGR